MGATHRRTLVCLFLLLSCSCAGILKPEYEYEEELYIALDGSARINVNASVPSLVALHGAALPVDPSARLDRGRLRALFAGPDAEVSSVSLSRRHGRRFVHVSVNVADVRQLSRLPAFAWSSYRFERSGDVFEFRHVVGAATGTAVRDIGWTGDELVNFRVHVPSVIPFHNATSHKVERGNIVRWDQPLRDRLEGLALDMRVHMESESILGTTLVLFAGTIVAAALTFAIIIVWVVRRGARAEAAGAGP